MTRLKENGYRLTDARKTFVETVAATPHALTPLEVYDRARAAAPGLGLVTVYRTLSGRVVGSWIRWTVLGSLVLLAIIGALILGQVLERSGDEEAIVIARVVTAKTSPDAGSADVFEIHEGLKVEIGDAVGEWLKITLSTARSAGSRHKSA